MNDSAVVLEINGVTKRYGRLAVLDNISFSVRKGSHLLILGPNGAGKTTLLKCILNLVTFAGEIKVNGLDVKQESTRVKESIGYVPQNYAFYENLSVFDQARMTSRLKRAAGSQVRDKLEMVDLWAVRDRKIGKLSDGMRQRLGIGLALIGDPSFLILDEPTSNVDLRGQLDFQDLLLRLSNEGKTMVSTSHLTGLGELATEVLVLDKGKGIALGEPQALIGRTGVADILYLRVGNTDLAEVISILHENVGNSITVKGNWLTAIIPREKKLSVLRSLLDKEITVDDLMIERGSIESEYLKLLEKRVES